MNKVITSLFMPNSSLLQKHIKYSFALSETALRAIWADKFWKTIIQGNKQISKMYFQQKDKGKQIISLRSKLLQLNIDDQLKKLGQQESQLSNQVKYAMLGYFNQKGVPINTLVYQQLRFFKAQSQTQVLENSSQQITPQNNIINFSFCPSYLVTSQIFDTYRSQNWINLFFGQQGIGKSTSFMLLSLLQNELVKFRIKSQTQYISVRKLLSRHHKIFYWSIPNDIFLQEDFSTPQLFLIKQELFYSQLINNVLAQCQQIHNILKVDEIKKKLTNASEIIRKEQYFIKYNLRTVYQIEGKFLVIFSNFIKQIKQIYQKKFGVSILLIVDQINVLASFMRKSNEWIKKQYLKNSSQSPQHIKLSDQQLFKIQIKLNYRTAALLDRVRRQLIFLGDKIRVFYNSSINLESDLLSSRFSSNILFKLVLNHQQNVDQTQIKFDQTSKYLAPMVDRDEFFKFEIQRQLGNAIQTNKIYEFLKQKFQYNPSPLLIRLLISLWKNIMKKVNDLQLEKKSQMIWEQYNKVYQSMIVDSHRNFLDKISPNDIEKFQINAKIIQILQRSLENENPISTIKENEIGFSMEKVRKAINLQIFLVQQDTDGWSLRFLINKDMMRKALAKTENKQTEILAQYIYKILKNHGNIKNQNFGKIFEFWILNSIQNSSKIVANQFQWNITRKIVSQHIQSSKTSFQQIFPSLSNVIHGETVLFFPMTSQKYRKLLTSTRQTTNAEDFVRNRSPTSKGADFFIFKKTTNQLFDISFFQITTQGKGNNQKIYGLFNLLHQFEQQLKSGTIKVNQKEFKFTINLYILNKNQKKSEQIKLNQFIEEQRKHQSQNFKKFQKNSTFFKNLFSNNKLKIYSINLLDFKIENSNCIHKLCIEQYKKQLIQQAKIKLQQTKKNRRQKK